MSPPPVTYDQILGMSYGFFRATPCTPASIEQFINMMKESLDACGASRERIYSDLERMHSVTLLDSSSILEDHGDHIEWFNPSLNSGTHRDIEWHFWTHFRDYMTLGKLWPKNVADGVDKETSEILSRLEDPTRQGEWDRRGMVMGSVQSGKTANYMGLIAKAIDAGYKLIVVMAGVHNSLRSQTQFRLNEEILGYDLDKVQEFRGQAESIGVRALFKDHNILQTLTSSSESGDFRKRIAEQAGIVPSRKGPAIVMVVKKHVSILKYLIDWSTSIIGRESDAGTRIVTDIPLLVIDDECDYASVNTKKIERDENGRIDPECDPAKTNQRIRELLNAFHKSAYVGYTATPFANIFIHHTDRHPTWGEDLFPRNFIISLPQATNYIGPERVFGLYDNPAAGIEQQEPLPLVVDVSDNEDLIPGKHTKDLQIETLPDSLKRAIKSFLIACAARRLRESSPAHNSMLIHVTRFTLVQQQIYDLVEKELRTNVSRIRDVNADLEDYRELWESDFRASCDAMKDEFGCRTHSWEEVLEHLYVVVRKVRVKMINGTSKDALQYREADMETKKREAAGEVLPWDERGVHVIAVGGDKLSRGLTLDGLTTSYYLRASRMYDTLMQMGRWFGFRDGYADLCRIYTTPELAEWYRFIATASLELRRELEYMSLIGEEPRNFGLKVLSHPGQLAVTSAGKRRNSEKLDLSYSGRLSQTVVFDDSQIAWNLGAFKDLVRAARREGTWKDSSSIPHWSGVSPQTVMTFLRAYRTDAEAARVVDPRHMASFIEEQLKYGEDDLTTWDIAIVSPKDSKKTMVLDDLEVNCSVRSPRSVIPGRSFSIGTLHDRRHEWVDFTQRERDDLVDRWLRSSSRRDGTTPDPSEPPPGALMRAARPKQRGLLLIYPIYCNEVGREYGMGDGQEVIGVAVSFPGSDTTRQVQYEVNSVYQDAED